jgi:aminopeptidase N
MNQVMTTMTRLVDYKTPDYLIEKIDLEFTLDEESTQVKSKLVIHANPACPNPNDHLVLFGEELELISILLDGKKLQTSQFEKTETELTLFNVPSSFMLEIETRIKPQENTALSGLYKSSGNFCTQCEAQGFRRMTYFLDRPDVMSRYTTTIIADEKRYPILLSNGNCVAAGKSAEGKHWVRWEDPFKKPCYLFALVAGDLEFIEDFLVTSSGRKVTLRIFVEKGNKDKCQHAMQAVKKAMQWDEKTFGREYDLDIYMIVAVSDFNMGAMENKGLNIFNTQYILAKPETATDMDFVHIESVIAHEYFHNWTGNRITCRDWFQLSLKEGLTIFRDQCFTADTTSRTVARINDVNDLRQTQFSEDAGPLAHPVRPDSYIEINNFYTSTVYNKGAEVIRMMQNILGNDLFRQGMDLYFTRHDGQAVTIEEFVKAMEDASNMDLAQFRLWYSQAGTPQLNIDDHFDENQKTYHLTVKQVCPPTPGQSDKKPMHIPVKIGLLDQSGREILHDLLHIKNGEQSFQFKNVQAKPVPSLLRNFSAPVQVNYQYTDDMLQLLFKHDTDLFNRWDAGQRYATNIILRLIPDFRAKKSLQVPADFIAAFKYLLQFMQDDKLLLTEMFTLPSEKYLAEQMDVIDVDGIHAVREFVLLELAKQLKNDFLQMYQDNQIPVFQFTMEQMGKRQLANLSLFYLMLLNDTDINKKLAFQQFRKSLTSNMTDTLAALRCLVNTDCPERIVALDEFYQQWQHDALVMDKWFALQATSKLPDTLANIKKLLQHPSFDIKNPNKVYALIGGFGARNAVHFHAVDGQGYQFLTHIILELNALNPQVAARMMKPLTSWKRYDKQRQQLMRQNLSQIAGDLKISKDVYEIVSKSLQN